MSPLDGGGVDGGGGDFIGYVGDGGGGDTSLEGGGGDGGGHLSSEGCHTQGCLQSSLVVIGLPVESKQSVDEPSSLTQLPAQSPEGGGGGGHMSDGCQVQARGEPVQSASLEYEEQLLDPPVGSPVPVPVCPTQLPHSSL